MSHKILIIDDEVDVMKMVVYRLKAKNYEVFTATDGKSGIELAKEIKPDLIILDYHLPDMMASEISKIIKSEESLKDVEIILVSASVEYLSDKAKECLAAAFIPKPIEPEELYEKVEKYIK
ncbi:MAG: response regulator [Pseudomonadota bacterium]